MKKIFQIPSILIAIILGGCATQQLSVEQHGTKWAPRLGVTESEIQFLSYGDFIAQFEDLDRRLVVEKGIIVLTDSDLRLGTRHFRYLFSKELKTVPFHKMEGVALIASQIHIQYGGNEIVLEFNPKSSRYAAPTEIETVFQLLASRGVPAYEVAELTKFPKYTKPRFEGSSFSENYPFYGDTRSDDYESYRGTYGYGDGYYYFY